MTVINYEKTSMNIRNRMIQLGLNATQLANEIEVSNQVVGYWLSGRNFPSVENYLKLCLALGVGPFELLEGDNL